MPEHTPSALRYDPASRCLLAANGYVVARLNAPDPRHRNGAHGEHLDMVHANGRRLAAAWNAMNQEAVHG